MRRFALLGLPLLALAAGPLAAADDPPPAVFEACPGEISAASSGKQVTAQDVVNCANKLLRGASSHARVSMTVERPEWKRTLEIESWNQGRDKAFILVHGPAKDKGTATLRLGPEMWLWMPRVERVVKVPPTMMHAAWMGSDFTYEDIVKADSILKDYTHTVLKREQEGDHEVVVVEALPKPDAPVVWGRVVLTAAVYPNGYVIAREEKDFSERGELIRTILFSDVGLLGGKTVPTRLECLPHRKPGQTTKVKYRELDFDLAIPDRTFSLDRLQKGR